MRVLALCAAFLAFASCKNETPPAPAAPVATASVPSSSAPLASASASPENPPLVSPSCASDDDCVLTSFPGCCACCECGLLKATTKSMDQAARDACQVKKCDSCDKKDYKCTPCKDPKKEGMHARCRDHTCILVETSSAAAPAPEPIACKTDDDCWMDDKNKPIARPKNLRGKKIEPCKGGHEHAPACGKESVCIVRAFKC